MHAVLLKSQGLTIERPPRTTGALVGGGAVFLALVLAAALLLKAIDWPVSFPQFLAYAGAALLLVVAGVFSFWTYACINLRYVLDGEGLAIRWGPVRHYIPINQLRSLTPGRGEQHLQIKGIGWLGYHIGRGYVEEYGDVLFFSTHRTPEDVVYIRASDTVYAVSPQDPARFIAEVERARKAGKSAERSFVRRDVLAAHPIWADRAAQWLGLAAIALNLALWGYVFAAYPDLGEQIKIQFPPIGDITEVHSRGELLKVPATATAILATNLLVGLGFQWKERAATYLLLSGAVFFQVLFLVAAVISVANA